MTDKPNPTPGDRAHDDPATDRTAKPAQTSTTDPICAETMSQDPAVHDRQSVEARSQAHDTELDDRPDQATSTESDEKKESGFGARVMAIRQKSSSIDHLVLAFKRFGSIGGSQLSAAISYYAFFAAFSLSLLAVAVFGYMLNIPRLYAAVEDWLETNLPVVDIAMLEDSRTGVGVLALAGLLIAGVAWVKAVRFSVRTIWGLPPEPGNLVVRWLVDLGVLVGLGILLITTVSITAGAEWLVSWVNDEAANGGGQTFLIAASSLLLGVFVNAILAAAILQALPRLAIPLRRIVGAALAVAIGLELLKTVGRFYITGATDRPAYQAVATAVGLLVFLYIFNQMLLFAAAWTATSQRGTAYDLSQRESIDSQRLAQQVESEPNGNPRDLVVEGADDSAGDTHSQSDKDSQRRE
ncbi:YihY/virulence factor BrkB family protein [Natronoglycomyces albus]|uniref:YihY/virulence factor BrkB family protein n=1 Tax=Natronoglycomyces albus TaxID=2811108 RepID=A0A895XKF7_9ACTN|nr:YihY/virulence factor BrkB family protein [Natronoglycomyces albus]QSB05824.1 YihY/virulence factor BrkB family protein [Natronoglycomyces albus]